MKKFLKKIFYRISLITILIGSLIIFPNPARAASVSDSTPGTVASAADAGTGCTNAATTDWATMTNTTVDDGVNYATYGGSFFDVSEKSEEFQLSNFGIAIPDGSTIDGVQVTINRKAGTANDVFDFNVSLTKTAGVQVGNNKADTATAYTTSDVTVTYGTGSTDKWGTTWSEAEIEASGFGVVICVQTDAGGNNEVASVDYVNVTVHYTSPTSIPTVSTDAETNVTAGEATLNGNISATGGENATVRGFAWGTSATLSNANTATTTETGDFGTGAFSTRIQTLFAGVVYYYRAYAVNSVGTSTSATIEQLTAGTDTSVTRKLRLFQSYTIKLRNGRIILHQK